MITRRTLAGTLGASALLPAAVEAKEPARRRAPKGFLWGTAISAHQSEGNNVNSDVWLLENLKPTTYKDRSGDACDSYHRFGEDIALNAALGFNTYRFGVEWARIEPSEGQFSNAELDHYEAVLKACRAHGQTPIVTLNHFSAPLWFSVRGGWERDDAPELFARYCAKVAERLGPLIGKVTTFNEANIQRLVKVLGLDKPSETHRQMMAAARKATGSERFTTLVTSNPAISEPILLEAHRRAYAAIKAVALTLPVGLSLTTQQIEAVGENSIAPKIEAEFYGPWIEAGRSHADFIGVQTYMRLRYDAKGPVGWPKGAEMTAAGYEFRPQALAETIRWAHRTFAGKPIYVTESGIATDDDSRRIAFIDQALDGVRQCLAEGIEVHSYLYWSLLDNFEWSSGYDKHFGLVAVDLKTFKRTPKPSAIWLGKRAKANLI